MHSVKLRKITEIYPYRFFPKKFVKLTTYVLKHTVNCFHGYFSRESKIFQFSTLCVGLLSVTYLAKHMNFSSKANIFQRAYLLLLHTYVKKLKISKNMQVHTFFFVKRHRIFLTEIFHKNFSFAWDILNYTTVLYQDEWQHFHERKKKSKKKRIWTELA